MLCIKTRRDGYKFQGDSGPAIRAAKGDHSKVYAKGTAPSTKPDQTSLFKKCISLKHLTKNSFYFHLFDVYIFLFCFSVKVHPANIVFLANFLPQLKPRISKGSCASRKQRRTRWQLVPTRGDTIQKLEAAHAPSTIGVSKNNLYLLGVILLRIFRQKSQALWGYIGSSSD